MFEIKTYPCLLKLFMLYQYYCRSVSTLVDREAGAVAKRILKVITDNCYESIKKVF